MKTICLIERVLVDWHGPTFRQEQDVQQLNLTQAELETLCNYIGPAPRPLNFTDHGLVSWLGTEYYMSSIERPVDEDHTDK